MIRSLFKRSGIYLLGLSASKVLSTAVFILFARSLNPADFGDLVLFHTLILMITYFADFGLNQWYQKKSHHDDKNKLFSQIINARIFTLIISLTISATFLFVSKSFNPVITLLFLIVLLSEAMLSIVDGYYLESGQPGKLSLKTAVRMMIYLLGYFVVKDTFSLDYAIYLYLISSVITAAWLFPWSKLKYFKELAFEKILSILKESSAYALLVATSFAYARGDSLVVRYMLNNSALGIYGAAYRYLEGLSMIPSSLSQNLFPVSAKKGNVSLSQVFKITTVMTLFGLLVGAVVFFSSDFLILTIIGRDYAQAVPVLKIFSGVLVLFFISAPLSTVVQSSDKVRSFLPYAIANTVLNIVLNLVFIPTHGILAAAWVMLTTEVTGLIINLYFIGKIYSSK